MFKSVSNADRAEAGAADVLIPLIRAAATISFAIAPCSLGFVIIAVSEQLIRSIMVGDDPEALVSDLQNQFPYAAIEAIENDHAGLVARVLEQVNTWAPRSLDPASWADRMRGMSAVPSIGSP